MKTGTEFEGAFFDGMLKAGIDLKLSTKEEDNFKGTDLFYENEIPLDPTHYWSGKDNIVLSYCKRICMGRYDLNVGVRTGNSHVTFDIPVIVIGLDADPHYVRDWIIPNLALDIKEHCSEIREAIEDTYYEYVDSVA